MGGWFSIPAMEHSTVTSWGRDRELDSYRNMLKQYGKPGSILACVIDSYDVFNAAEKLWGEDIRQEVIDSGATVVIRPDSGDPTEVCLRLVDILGKKFGFTTNDKGFDVLNHVRIIQGDGINEESINSILTAFTESMWSADNIAFGMGGQLLQGVNRDTQKFAMKCSAVEIDGEWKNVRKEPITDMGKLSKAGRVTLYKKRDGYFHSGVEGWEPSALVPVFEDGELLFEYDFEEVRRNSNQ